ncbi:unnamed protein product, partial [Aphanomyces euteiches]
MKRRRRESVVALPGDIVMSIIFFIPDPLDVRKCVAALRRKVALRLLEQLYHLSLELLPYEFWPCQRIDMRLSTSCSLPMYGEIMQYYSRVIVSDFTNVQWFKQHLNRNAEIEWVFPREPRKLVMKWMDMRITRRTVMNGWKFPSEWKFPPIHDREQRIAPIPVFDVVAN